MKLVLDTNFFILHYFSTGDQAAKTKAILNKCRKVGNAGLIPTIVVGESYAAIQRIAGRIVADKAYCEIVNSGLQLLDLTADIAKKAGELRIRSQETVPWGDCIIAATALVHGADLIVSEDRHFKKFDDIDSKNLEEIRL